MDTDAELSKIRQIIEEQHAYPIPAGQDPRDPRPNRVETNSELLPEVFSSDPHEHEERVAIIMEGEGIPEGAAEREYERQKMNTLALFLCGASKSYAEGCARYRKKHGLSMYDAAVEYKRNIKERARRMAKNKGPVWRNEMRRRFKAVADQELTSENAMTKRFDEGEGEPTTENQR